MRRWYVVYTHVNGERKAEFNLKRQNFEVYLPQYLKRRRHARRTDRTVKPLFPRYLFVSFDINVDRWRSVYSTFGVDKLISFGEHPIKIPTEIVEAIRAREDHVGHIKIHDGLSFKQGDPIRMIDGPMADAIGIFENIADEERVNVLLDLLGRQVRVKIPLEAIAAHA